MLSRLGLWLLCTLSAHWTCAQATLDAQAQETQAQDTLVLELRADDWCPYTCQPKAAHQGIITDLVRHILTQAGIESRYQLVPWNRALRELDTGRAQLILGITPTEAPHLVFGQRPLFYAQNHWFIRTNSQWTFTGLGALEQVRLGAVAGYGYGGPIDDYIQAHEDGNRVQLLSASNPVRRNLLKLRQHRIDVLIEDCLVVARQLDGFPQIISAGPASSIPLYVGFAPNDPRAHEWARLLDLGIERLVASGELEQLLTPYQDPMCAFSPALPPGNRD